MPEPLGRPVYVRCFVDADHGGNFIKRRLHSVILLFVNNTLTKSFRKRQNMVESSTFGSELVALKIVRDTIVDIRIKLKMFGVPLNVPENVLCDNNGVVKNTRIPKITLFKKHNAINWHCMRKADTDGILRIRKEDNNKPCQPINRVDPLLLEGRTCCMSSLRLLRGDRSLGYWEV